MVRSEGSALHASIGTMSGCVLNIILDPIFILPWGLNLGAEGAGLATFLSNCGAFTYFLVLLYKKRKETYVCIRPDKFSFDKKIVMGICDVGIPASIQNLLNVTGMTLLNNFTSSFGADAVLVYGFSGCWCVPGCWPWKICPCVCNHEKSSFGNSGTVYSEYTIPVIWISICTAYSRGGSCSNGSYSTYKTFQKTG